MIFFRRQVRAVIVEAMSALDKSSQSFRPGPVRAGEDGPEIRTLKAARKLFFEEGFDGITTDRLAREAGVSKASIYKYFGDMTAVLRAVAEAEADHAGIGEVAPAKDVEGFLVQLTEIGASLLALIEQPDKQRFDRLVHEQARDHPDLAETYWQAIYARTQTQLADLLVLGQDLGAVPADQSAAILADQLLSMWQGLTAARLRLGLRPIDTRSARDRSADAVRTLVG